MTRFVRRLLTLSPTIFALLLAACTPDSGGETPTITVTASPLSVLADGKNTVAISITAVLPGGDPATGLLVLTTDRGTFDGGGKSLTGPLTAGAFGPVTLTSCDSFADTSCAGTARVRATLGPASSSVAITFEPWLRETDCEDGLDDDGDQLIDCQDIDDCADGLPLSDGKVCRSAATACEPGGDTVAAEPGTEATCDDGIDNDCDGVIDCADPDCAAQTCGPNSQVCAGLACICSPKDANGNPIPGETTETSCQSGDNVDTDCDGLVDGDDPDCQGLPCDNIGNRWIKDSRNPGTWICDCDAATAQATETSCIDGIDNDCKNGTDCQDPACDGFACLDPNATNQNGLACSTPAAACVCPGDPLGLGTETDCANGIDDNCDGTTDCADPDCPGNACGSFGLTCTLLSPSVCECPGGTTEVACGDNNDNDCDGDYDCQDADCQLAGATCGANGLACDNSGNCSCPGGQFNESNCSDNQDNDCDGLRDCADSDCDVLSCGTGCAPSSPCICDAATSTCVQDPGLNKLTFTSDMNRVIAALPVAGVQVTLTAHVFNNASPGLVGYAVTVNVAVGTLVESGTATYTGPTDASGDLIVHWLPGAAPAKLIEATATIISDPVTSATSSKIVAIDVIGLESISVISVEFSTMGAKDSGWQETSNIIFTVTGTNGIDTGLIIPDGVPVAFSTSSTAGGVNLTIASTPTLNGLVQTTVNAGTQSVSFTVQASATVVGVTRTVQTGTINIVGAWPSNRGFTFTCDKKNVNGLGSFTNDSDFVTTQVTTLVTCRVNVNDRWLNPIQNPNVVLGFQSEGGTIQTNKSVTNGLTTTVFNTFGSLAFDTTPLTNEPSWSHTNGGTTQIRNPRDGFYTIIAFTSGEEEFNDNDGNGIYDAGERFVDLGEPYIDRDDSGTWDVGEQFTDSNNNGTFDGPNGVWDANTTIWDQTRIVVSGCCADAGVTGLGFQTSFGAIADGGSATSLLRLSDINMNRLAGGTSVTLAVVTGNPISTIEFADGKTSRTLPDGWGINWVKSQDTANFPQVTRITSISFTSTASYGDQLSTFARDGNPNNAACVLGGPPCTQTGAVCTDLGGGVAKCLLAESFQVRAETGPCTPKAIFFGSGTVD